jgi:hypothetical protein
MFLQVASFGEEKVAISKPDVDRTDSDHDHFDDDSEAEEMYFGPDHFHDDDILELFPCCPPGVCGLIDPFHGEVSSTQRRSIGTSVQRQPKLQSDYGVQVNMVRYALVLKPTGMANLEFKRIGIATIPHSMARTTDWRTESIAIV